MATINDNWVHDSTGFNYPKIDYGVPRRHYLDSPATKYGLNIKYYNSFGEEVLIPAMQKHDESGSLSPAYEQKFTYGYTTLTNKFEEKYNKLVVQVKYVLRCYMLDGDTSEDFSEAMAGLLDLI